MINIPSLSLILNRLANLDNSAKGWQRVSEILCIIIIKCKNVETMDEIALNAIFQKSSIMAKYWYVVCLHFQNT